MEDSGSQPNQQPGQTITPTAVSGAGSVTKPPQPTANPAPPAPPPQPAAPVPAPAPPPAPEAAPQENPLPEKPQNNDNFDTAQPEPPKGTDNPPDAQTITWTASEFIAHAKSFGWYAALGLSAIALAALVFLLTKDPVSTGVVIFGAVIFGIYAGRQPRELEYRLDDFGLTIGQKRLGYNQFRCFSVLPEGGVSSIVFMPLKRFAMPTTIYYPPEDEDRIVSLLGSRLPLEERGHDAVDRLMHRIHF